MCIDWDHKDPYLIYGSENSPDNQRLELILTPCNYMHGKDDKIAEECISDPIK